MTIAESTPHYFHDDCGVRGPVRYRAVRFTGLVDNRQPRLRMTVMRTYHCFIRTGLVHDLWHSTHETPTILIEAMDHGHAAQILSRVPAHNPCATFHNMWVTDAESGVCEVFTSRRGKDGSFCAVRPWNASVDLNLPEYTALRR